MALRDILYRVLSLVCILTIKGSEHSNALPDGHWFDRGQRHLGRSGPTGFAARATTYGPQVRFRSTIYLWEAPNVADLGGPGRPSGQNALTRIPANYFCQCLADTSQLDVLQV